MRPRNTLASAPVSLLLTLPLLFTALASAKDQLPNGLKIEVTKAVPCTRKSENGDVLTMKYRGTLLTNGKEFDSNFGGGGFHFKLGAGAVIKGWDMGLLDMCVGEQRNLTIAPELAYGHKGAGDDIPPDATLRFETELLHIKGVHLEPGTPIGISAGVPTAAAAEDKSAPKEGHEDGPKHSDPEDTGECKLLGSFAILVQAALGALALLSLVYKRWRETPRRPLKIWSFDVSKQVVGSALLHLANLFMSLLSSGDLSVASQGAGVSNKVNTDERQLNPCSFYLLNLAIDTTLGIPVLVLLLRLLHMAFSHTPLANPPESLKSGNYGHPPHASWWLKQSFIYFLGLFGMKLCVFLLFQILPWLAWVGDWALRWTEGNTALQIVFVMLVFPLIMNALQYWIIDSFIKDRASSWEEHGHGQHEPLPTEEADEDERLMGAGRRGSEDSFEREEREAGAKDGGRLKEANPTPLDAETYRYNPDTDGEGSRGGSSGTNSRGSEEERKK